MQRNDDEYRSALADEWRRAKEAEASAVEKRRAIEDELIAMYGIEDHMEGTQKHDNFKVTCRLTRKVDSDLLQEIAAENGTSEHLSTLFRWTPAINMTLWKATSPEITKPLEAAITVKPGRPSFKLEIKD